MRRSAKVRRKQKISDIAVIVEDPGWRRESPAVARFLRRAAQAALVAAGAPKKACLTLLLSNDARLKDLNRRFRRRNAPTNVLSFPSRERGYLGDVAIALGTAANEAAAADKSLRDHAAHLAVHGTLHLLGYDHVRPREAHAMEALERQILGSLGVADPYRAREAA